MPPRDLEDREGVVVPETPSLVGTQDDARARIAASRASMQLDASDLELIALRRAAAFEAFTAPDVAHEPAAPRPALLAEALEQVADWLYALRHPARVLFVGLVAYLFAFNLSIVRGSSMAPGIHDGDRILIDQLSYVFTGIERGDIVVLRYPLDPSVDYIKRVVALPGDEVVMAAGTLWVNGERVDEGYVAEQDVFAHVLTRVKPGHYFVLGDNRPHSSDSREFGQVPEELIRGKVDLRLWPPSRIGTLD
ncbi:MAG: signal peptidase I [Planctomycetes bacterium]|nr:signal peptidase I [Planctomycetota bacterium]